ncbi:hypothetical protein BD410DRAFT_585553 [Rickenella mellea]|uniref:Uncharacterized protein n=1 Tax=Rickenella mellea TaxID=50990 RepID=A0A4Y7PR51_9AGAM|nr:hypothetical protein BD410DRAFT_585553 [Rickenella mellea]
MLDAAGGIRTPSSTSLFRIHCQVSPQLRSLGETSSLSFAISRNRCKSVIHPTYCRSVSFQKGTLTRKSSVWRTQPRWPVSGDTNMYALRCWSAVRRLHNQISKSRRIPRTCRRPIFDCLVPILHRFDCSLFSAQPSMCNIPSNRCIFRISNI